MTVSSWWLIFAFVLGIHAGIVLMALLYLSSKEPEEPEQLPSAVGHGS